MISIAIYGSTGSIGVQTLNVVRRFPELFKIESLSGGNNTDLLIKQISEFKPKFCASVSEVKTDCDCYCGKDAVLKMAARSEADVSVFAIPGTDSVYPLISVIKKGKRIALASKESLVTAGKIVMDAAVKYNAEIIPVDSEHSAVFQCLSAGKREDVKRIVLTASGGPFYGKTLADLDGVTPAQAIKHPTWNMGKKVSVDSATMVNKGLEIIEASILFNCTIVDYVIHPESIIHSIVEFMDNSSVALMSYPNMELPIQYALTYPSRLLNESVRAFDFTRPLTFREKDESVFKGPALAKKCLASGAYYPAVFSMADEEAVNLFLSDKIRFTEIYDVIDHALSCDYSVPKNVEEVKELSNKVRSNVISKFQK